MSRGLTAEVKSMDEEQDGIFLKISPMEELQPVEESKEIKGG